MLVASPKRDGPSKYGSSNGRSDELNNVELKIFIPFV